MGVLQIVFMLIACPQSLHVIRVPPTILLVVVYMPQAYALLRASAEGIGTAPTDVDSLIPQHHLGVQYFHFSMLFCE